MVDFLIAGHKCIFTSELIGRAHAPLVYNMVRSIGIHNTLELKFNTLDATYLFLSSAHKSMAVASGPVGPVLAGPIFGSS